MGGRRWRDKGGDERMLTWMPAGESAARRMWVG